MRTQCNALQVNTIQGDTNQSMPFHEVTDSECLQNGKSGTAAPLRFDNSDSGLVQAVT